MSFEFSVSALSSLVFSFKFQVVSSSFSFKFFSFQFTSGAALAESAGKILKEEEFRLGSGAGLRSWGNRLEKY